MVDGTDMSLGANATPAKVRTPVVKRALRSLGHRVRAFLLHPPIRYSGSFFAMQRFFKYMSYEDVIRTCLEFVKNSHADGDYLEFGVFQGASFTAAYHLAQRLELPHLRFYAFDGFQGLPEVGDVDAAGFKHFEKGEYACDEQSFRKLIAKKGVDLSRVEITPGWFDQTLNEETKSRLPLKAAALVMIDCDLYASTVPVLEFITDYVQDGTILIFDDWYCYRGNPHRGQQRAFSEWLQRNPRITAVEFQKMGWAGCSFILSIA